MGRTKNQPRKWRTRDDKVLSVVKSIEEAGFRSPNDFIEAYYASPNAPQALRFQPGANYSPSTVMDTWLENVPSGDSRDHLQKIITEKATNIMIRESARACKDSSLQMNHSSLDIPYLTGETESDFGFGKIRERYLALLPCMTFMLHALVTAPNEYERREGVEKQGKQELAEKIIVVLISILLYSRNNGTNAFQMVMGVFMASSGASRRIIDNFNHIGLCVSYWTIQRALKQLSEDSKTRARDFVTKSGRLWGVVYDNINFTLRKASQRLDSATQQINATTLAVFSLPRKFTQAAYNAALSVTNRNRRLGARKNEVRVAQETFGRGVAYPKCASTQLGEYYLLVSVVLVDNNGGNLYFLSTRNADRLGHIKPPDLTSLCDFSGHTTSIVPPFSDNSAAIAHNANTSDFP